MSVVLAMLPTRTALADPDPCQHGFVEERTKIHPHVTFIRQSCASPVYRALALLVDLTSPHISFQVTPRGAGRMTTSEFAQEYGAFAAVNGGYRSDEGGYTVSDSQLWGEPGDTEFSSVIGFGERNEQGVIPVQIRPPEEVLEDVPGWMTQAVSGHPLVLREGKPVDTDDYRYLDRHPRTAAGISQDGRTLALVTVDGRRKHWSLGMRVSQLAAMMKRLGVHRAVNLDGGGSTTMVIPSLGGRQNWPCDRKREERPVLNHIGIMVHGMDWAWPQQPAFSPPDSWQVLAGGLGAVAPHLIF